ncbi:MAG: NAD-dependent epimerase/dehydratase family protein [Thermoleophilaceae bacterium]
MKAFVTGGTGFIGQHLVQKLRERGDEVIALVRSRERGQKLAAMGAELYEGDLSDQEDLQLAMPGCDAVFHGAAISKVGIPRSEQEQMYDTNVRGTERVLDAATAAGVLRIVYVSTVNVFGNTGGDVVDEAYKRDTSGNGFLSYYDETKWKAHEVALDRIGQGAPVVIVQPGGVYGPDDHSEVGNMIDQVRTGKLFAVPFPDMGLNLVHVDDVAEGCLLAHDKGEIGQSYVLGGEISTMRGLVEKVAAIEGKKAPKRTMPTALIKAVAPADPVLGKIMGFPPNFKELVSTSDGVTYWAKDDKARQRLGYTPRDLDTGLRQTLAASS